MSIVARYVFGSQSHSVTNNEHNRGSIASPIAAGDIVSALAQVFREPGHRRKHFCDVLSGNACLPELAKCVS